MAKTTEDIFPALLVCLLILYPPLALGSPFVRREDIRHIDLTCDHIGTYHSDEGTRHYDLAVFSIFKNEADVMEEWLEHHIWQGVQHFFMVDNNSTDHIHSIIQPYITSGRVTMCRTPSKSPQDAALEHLRVTFAEQCTWIMPIDLDEFMFSTVPGMDLKGVLLSRFPPDTNISTINVPWHNFGSSGLKTQPDCVRSSFTMRKKFKQKENTKYIIRGKCASKLKVHNAEWYLCRDTGNVRNPPDIKLFHYRIMSEERFQRVKMSRGDADNPGFDSLRNMEYFAHHDYKDTVDNTLKDMLGPFGCYPMRRKNVKEYYQFDGWQL